MPWGILSLLGIGINVAKDAYKSNQKYYGTDREMWKNNKRMQEQDEITRKICEKHLGRKVDW